MTPALLAEYLETAKKAGAEGFDLEVEGIQGSRGFKLRVGFGSGGGLVPHRPKAGEVEGRLGEVDDDILYGSSGG